MEYLGLDMWMQILSKLGVKDLLRLKSVSKAFLDLISSLISNHDFIRLHLNKSSLRAIHLSLSTCRCLKQHGEAESSFRVIPIRRQTYLASLRRHGGEVPGLGTMIDGMSCGSHNGLVCLLPKINCKFGGGILLWNPALHEAEFIPIKRPQEEGVFSCWFGYDNGEYKLILGTTSRIHFIRLYIDTNTWKSSFSINTNYCRHFDFKGTLVHRTVHWATYYSHIEKYHTIITFDLRNETVGRIATPDGMMMFRPFVVGEVDGCLSTMFPKFMVHTFISRA